MGSNVLEWSLEINHRIGKQRIRVELRKTEIVENEEQCLRVELRNKQIVENEEQCLRVELRKNPL